jgi:hypothetical protein
MNEPVERKTPDPPPTVSPVLMQGSAPCEPTALPAQMDCNPTPRSTPVAAPAALPEPAKTYADSDAPQAASDRLMQSPQSRETSVRSGQESVSPAPCHMPYNEFVGKQYEQLHELKRMYNGMIFQAPSILVAVLGLLGFLLDKALDEKKYSVLIRQSLPLVGLVLGMFAFVLSYWAYRSRLILKAVEVELSEFDRVFGVRQIKVYPFQLIQKRKTADRKQGGLRRGMSWIAETLSNCRHSTVLIIVFMFGVSFVLTVVSLVCLVAGSWFGL